MRWIAAVSGGSYMAGLFTLINAGSRASDCDGQPLHARDLDGGMGPIGQGSPEERHVLQNGRYLMAYGPVRMAIILVSLMLASVVSFLASVGFEGVLLASAGGVGLLLEKMLSHPIALGGSVSSLSICILWSAALITLRLRSAHWWVRLPFAIAVAGFAPAVLAKFESINLLGPLNWLSSGWLRSVIAASILAVAIAAWVSTNKKQGIGPFQGAAFVSIDLIIRAIILAGVLELYFLCAIVVYRHVDSPLIRGFPQPPIHAWLKFLALVSIWVVLAQLPGLASPHRVYRRLLGRCFVAIRVNDRAGAAVRAVDRPDEVALSSLLPPVKPGAIRYPELIMCGAANVGRKRAPHGVLPIEITGHTLCLPSIKGATIPIELLEKLPRNTTGRPRNWLNQPLMSLSSAMAISGAAVAPIMGRYTSTTFRPILGILNLRLGVWLPNPACPGIQDQLKIAKATIAESGMGEFLAELLGATTLSRAKVYVSDGGHYENLGLTALVRRECLEIWCIDASDDPPGTARALEHALLLAERESGAVISIDISCFQQSSGSRRLVKSTHSSGTVAYQSGAVGKVHVIKLGLTDRHSPSLREYSATDKGFPKHNTVRQSYGSDRIDAYRRLGRESTLMLLEGRANVE